MTIRPEFVLGKKWIKNVLKWLLLLLLMGCYCTAMASIDAIPNTLLFPFPAMYLTRQALAGNQISVDPSIALELSKSELGNGFN